MDTNTDKPEHHRLTNIVTRTGDDGSTSLGDGRRVRKDDLRVMAMGDVDELNSTIGVLLTQPLPADVQQALTDIQHDLFDLGSELAVPGLSMLSDAQLARLEQQVTHWNSTLKPLKEFILPGGSPAAALAHVSRAVARRAERSVVHLTAFEQGPSTVQQRYLNRLSDLLFVLARVLNQAAGRSDVCWQQRKNAAN